MDEKNIPLYRSEFEVTEEEYSKLVFVFPDFYRQLSLRGTLIVLFACVILGVIIYDSFMFVVILAIIAEIIMLIGLKMCIPNLAKNAYRKMQKKKKLDIRYTICFYEDYFIRCTQYGSHKVLYSQLDNIIETETNFYMIHNGAISIVLKSNCEDNLIKFIVKQIKSINKKSEYPKHTGLIKVINLTMLILLIFSILSIPAALFTWNYIAKNSYGFEYFEYTWAYFIWITIPFISLIAGIVLRKKGINCKINCTIGIIVAIILLIIGALLPSSQGKYEKIIDYQSMLNIELPEEGSVEYESNKNYLNGLSNFKKIEVTFESEDTEFLKTEILNSETWINEKELDTELRSLVPASMIDFNRIYISIYNKTLDEYNTLPSESGEYEMCIMRYDAINRHLEINEYEFVYVK